MRLYEGTENAEIKKIFETLKSLKSTKEINDYFSKLEQNSSNPSDKLVLIFPGYGQYSIVASLIWFFEINARVFTSVTDCVSVMNSLSNNGKKYSQIYIFFSYILIINITIK